MNTNTINKFLSSYCWDAPFRPETGTDVTPARIIAVDRGRCLCAVPSGQIHVRMRSEDTPAVGDWCLLDREDPPLITSILPRTGVLKRTRPGQEHREQVVAANCDTVLIQISSEEGLRTGKALRLSTAARESGADPVILISKADLHPEPELLEAAYRSMLPDVPILAVSASSGAGITELEGLCMGRTSVLIGPSGSGKSTLINRLLGEDVQATGSVREEDGRGRHTTVRRYLFRLPSGGCLIDTPGIREWGLAGYFGDTPDTEIERIAEGCRYRDCTHTSEPDCAVTEAVRNRILPAEVYRAYLKLRAEQRQAEIRRSPKTRREEERRWAKTRRTANSWRKKKRNKP